MKILAVDTSCDESCAAVLDVDRWALLSDVVHTHIGKMEKYGGVVPEIASREHVKALPLAVHEALEQANLKLRDIDWFTVTHRPGLIGALLVGVSYVKALAFAAQKPFFVLDHIEAHLFSPLLCTMDDAKAPPFPWIALVVSGGHTELFHVVSELEYRWLGGTLDDAAGEAFDKVGKLLSFPYPAGPALDRWVREKGAESHRSTFRFPRADTPDFHFSYSGLKTAVSQQLRKMGAPSDEERLSLASSAQEAILDPIVENTRKASEQLHTFQIVVTGGVACNSRLREKLPRAHFPKPKHCSDNAAMVALLAGLYARAGRLEPSAWGTSALAFSKIAGG